MTKNKNSLGKIGMLTQKQKFFVGIGMQILQLLIATVFVLALADWRWFKIQYLYAIALLVVFLMFNFISWRLILKNMNNNEKGG